MSLTFLQVALFLTVFVALGMFGYALLSAPSTPPGRLGLRGYKRISALRDNEGFAQLEPLMRWLSTRLGGLLAPSFRLHLDEQITRAGDVLGLQPEDVVSLSVLSSAGGLCLGAGYSVYTESGPLFVLVGLALGLLLPYFQLTSAAQKRVRSIQRALPHIVDLMVLGLGAGLDFPGAVRQVVDKAGRDDEPLIEELRLLLQELKLGRTRGQALLQFVERVPCDAVRDLSAAAAQAEEQGTPLAGVLAAQATSSRQRRTVQAEETAARASTVLMLPMALLFVAVLMLIVSPMVLTLGERF